MDGPNRPSPEVIYTMPVFNHILHDIFNVPRCYNDDDNTGSSSSSRGGGGSSSSSSSSSGAMNLQYSMQAKACFISIYSYTLKNRSLLQDYYVQPDVVAGFLHADLIAHASTKRNILTIIRAYSLNASLSLHMINADNDLFHVLALYLKVLLLLLLLLLLLQ